MTVFRPFGRQSAEAAEAELAARIGFAGVAGAGSLPDEDAADAHSGNTVSCLDPTTCLCFGGQLHSARAG